MAQGSRMNHGDTEARRKPGNEGARRRGSECGVRVSAVKNPILNIFICVSGLKSYECWLNKAFQNSQLYLTLGVSYATYNSG